METLFSQKLPNDQIRCQTCAQFCQIKPGQRGICGIRENTGEHIKVLNFGHLVTEAVDPIEKKPLFHFLPGTQTYSIATAGCNFTCGHCQNWQISQIGENTSRGQYVSPDKVIQEATQTNCRSISYTYTEPTIFTEYALEVMKLAHKQSIKNVWVSNGYMSEKTRQAIIPYLDAINIDLKAFSDKFYQKSCHAKLQPVLDNIVAFKKAKVWVELTTLIIPTQNDSLTELENIAKFIANEVGPETPWHVSKFSPEISYQTQNLPATDIQTIAKAISIGKEAGLKYIYSGNLLNHSAENTYCPHCQEIIIKRDMLHTKIIHPNAKNCPNCRTQLDIIW